MGLQGLSNWVLAALVVSLAATLATLPLVAFNFHRIPLFGIFGTVLALPALPFVLLGSLITALAGLANPVLGQFFGWLTWVPLSYLLGLVNLAPGETVSGSWVGAPLVWAWYLVAGWGAPATRRPALLESPLEPSGYQSPASSRWEWGYGAALRLGPGVPWPGSHFGRGRDTLMGPGFQRAGRQPARSLFRRGPGG